MDRIRQHIHRRRRSSASSTTPLQSPTLSASDKRKKSRDNGPPRHLVVTSDTPEFDKTLIHRLEAEGLSVKYLPFLGGGQDLDRDRKDLEKKLSELEDDLEPGERYAVVAYKRPAYLLLVSHHQSTTTTNPLPRLCALVAYYPKPPENLGRHTNPTPCEAPSSPIDGISTYSSHTLLPLQVHLAAHQSPAMYDNYFLNINKKRHRCYVFSYPESQIGFAEHAEPTYDRIDAQLAWSRALDCVKRGFGPGASWSVSNIEAVWTKYWQHLTKTSAVDGHAEDSMDMMVGGLDDGEDHGGHDDHEGGPSVNCIPTMVKGTNSTFPKTTFFPTGPQSQHIRLLTRTIGPDRIVDEVLLSFTHTDEIPWLLPGVPPTNRHVQIPLVLTGSFCAGKLARQNVYWDQASVLVQVGLLDPGLVPGGFAAAVAKGGKGGIGVERMPACGSEEVQGVLDV